MDLGVTRAQRSWTPCSVSGRGEQKNRLNRENRKKNNQKNQTELTD
jgi:hypothetical protein